MRRLIIFLIRRRLRLKKFEWFQFVNQKSKAVYYFTYDKLMKMEGKGMEPSSVSLNWILDNECAIRRIEK